MAMTDSSRREEPGVAARVDRRHFLGAATGLAAAVAARRVQAGPDSGRPNVLFVFTDDQRWDTMGCAGNAILKTPNMDRLAGEGFRFSNAFVTTSICAPSRASFLCGKYAYRHGVRDLGIKLPEGQKTFPEILREAGYRTGYVGKYHLGGDEDGQKRFDYWGGFRGQGRYEQGEQHLTDVLTERAVNYLREQGDAPFCLVVGYKAPHGQDGARPEFRYAPRFTRLFQDVAIPYPPTYEGSYEKKPECVRTSLGRTRWGWRHATREMFQETAKSYYRLIAGVDEGLGRILETLDDLRVADNTVVIYTSDNGFFLGEHGMAGKWLMYEESIRVPLVMRYPRLLPEAGDARLGPVRGAVRHAASDRRPASDRDEQAVAHVIEGMALSIDVAPTVLDLCGVPIPADMQGRSLRPLCEGRTDANWRTAYLYEYFGGHNVPPIEGVRTPDWKYIKYLPHKDYGVVEELYHIASDRHEMTDLAKDPQHADVLGVMKELLEQLKFETRGTGL